MATDNRPGKQHRAIAEIQMESLRDCCEMSTFLVAGKQTSRNTSFFVNV